MKAAAFDYVRAQSLAEALDLLSQHGPEAKLLAGGQSLLPALNLRLSAPAILIDISRIEALRGKVDIENRPAQGTVITISLPLTMAIIDGLQVRVNQELYIIPLAMVEECVEFIREGSRESRKRSTTVRGLNVPYVRLREAFALAGESPSLEQLVVIRHGMGRAGIVVDEVLGLQQTVIKGLGKLIGRVEGIAGATINVDGSMALILDAEGLVNGVQRQWEQTWA